MQKCGAGGGGSVCVLTHVMWLEKQAEVLKSSQRNVTMTILFFVKSPGNIFECCFHKQQFHVGTSMEQGDGVCDAWIGSCGSLFLDYTAEAFLFVMWP